MLLFVFLYLNFQINLINSIILILVTKYTNIENWYDQNSANYGQIGGIAINKKSDNIYVFHRGSQIWQQEYDLTLFSFLMYFNSFGYISSFNDEYIFNTRKYSVIKENTIIVMNRNTGKIIDSWGSNMYELFIVYF